MSHPPIPPNSDFFVDRDGETYFVLEVNTLDTIYIPIFTNHFKARHRKIIAAVAAEAWQEEFNRLHEQNFELLNIKRRWSLDNKRKCGRANRINKFISRVRLDTERRIWDAKENIDSWRRWGKEAHQ